MKKPKTTTEKPTPKAKAEQPITTATAKAATKKTSPAQNTAKKAQAATTQTPAITMPERIGLTAGSIWHFLSENGATPVAKLVRELQEEEKVIHRSIGWLAQEGKITLDIVERTETIALKA